MSKLSQLIPVLCATIFANGFVVEAQTYPEHNNRKTHKNNLVPVVRDYNPPSRKTWEDLGFPGDPPDMKRLRMSEWVNLKLYKDLELVVSVSEYQFIRNCHDYAFRRFMSCFCLGIPSGNQKECWWMLDPRENWKDGSMVPKVVSTDLVVEGNLREYLFNTSDAQTVSGTYYYNPEHVTPFPLPVCPLSDLDQNPTHSALLLQFTPTASNPALSFGTYQSKWGFGGGVQAPLGFRLLPSWLSFRKYTDDIRASPYRVGRRSSLFRFLAPSIRPELLAR